LKIYYRLNDLINNNLNLYLNGEKKLTIKIKKQLNNNDMYICIDGRTHLIEGLDSEYQKTNTLYNRYIISGDFFSLPVGKNTFTTDQTCNKITYNYLYY
jgi:hypothetical protein